MKTYFFHHLHQLRLVLLGLLLMRVALFRDVLHALEQLLDVGLVLFVLIQSGSNGLVFLNDLIAVLNVRFGDLLKRPLDHVTVPHQLSDVAILIVSLAAKPLNLTSECADRVFGCFLLLDGIKLVFFKHVQFMNLARDLESKLALFLFNLNIGGLDEVELSLEVLPLGVEFVDGVFRALNLFLKLCDLLLLLFDRDHLFLPLFFADLLFAFVSVLFALVLLLQSF